MRLLISFLLLLSFGLAQESKQSVEGSVQDPSHAVIPKCVVVLQGAVDDTRRWSATTDPSGRFAFEGIPQGRYTLDVSHDGFKHAQVPLEINARKIRHLVIVLSIAAVNETVQGETTILSWRSIRLRTRMPFPKMRVCCRTCRSSTRIHNGALRFPRSIADRDRRMSLMVMGESTKVGLSPSAIRQVKINNDPYAAEYFRPGRAGLRSSPSRLRRSITGNSISLFVTTT